MALTVHIDRQLIACMMNSCSFLSSAAFYPGTILYFVTPMQTSHWQPLTQHTPPDEFKISFSRQQETRDAPVESYRRDFPQATAVVVFRASLVWEKIWVGDSPPRVRYLACCMVRAGMECKYRFMLMQEPKQ